MRITYWVKEIGDDPLSMSITEAKKLLKSEGGYAWTEHYDRDGCMFEATDVKLTGNNSRVKYNCHL